MLELIRKIVFQVTGKNDINYDTDFVQDLRLNSYEIMNIDVYKRQPYTSSIFWISGP